MNLSPRHADLVLKFLGNTNIVGNDAPLFMECVLLLRTIAAQASEDEPKQVDQDILNSSTPVKATI